MNTRSELPLVCEWLSSFLAGESVVGRRFSAAYDRAFLRRLFDLQEIADGKGSLWKPLAAYAASRLKRGGNEKNLLIRLLDAEGGELAAAKTAAVWADWLMRTPSEEGYPHIY